MSDDRRCLIIDPQPMVRLGVRELLATHYDVDGVPSWGEAKELFATLGGFDVAVVDVDRNSQGDPSGPSLVKLLRRAVPSTGIVARARRADRRAATEVFRAGATAFISKAAPADVLQEAIASAVDHKRFIDPAAASQKRVLTKRQREILQFIADGTSTAAVARQLGLSAETVRTHMKGTLARLEARDRTHAVAIAMRASLIE